MNPKSLIKTSIWAWVGGIVCFFFPFLSQSFRGESFHINALTLMTKISTQGAMDDDMPINGYLWVALLAGIVGALATWSCDDDWDEVRESTRPIVATISGVVALFCLYSFNSIYSFDSFEAREYGLTTGWGRNFAMLCVLVAVACLLVACVMQSAEHKALQAVGVSAARESEKVGDPSAPAVSHERQRKTAYVDAPRAESGTVTCPICGCVQRSDRVICFQCGAKFVFQGEMPAQSPTEPQTDVICTCGSCGYKYQGIPAGEQTCPNCGSTLKLYS